MTASHMAAVLKHTDSLVQQSEREAERVSPKKSSNPSAAASDAQLVTDTSGDITSSAIPARKGTAASSDVNVTDVAPADVTDAAPVDVIDAVCSDITDSVTVDVTDVKKAKATKLRRKRKLHMNEGYPGHCILGLNTLYVCCLVITSVCIVLCTCVSR